MTAERTDAGALGRLIRCCVRATGWVSFAAAFAAGQAAAAVDVTDAHRELFVGDYRGVSSGLEASLTIAPDLQYVYIQERAEVTRLGKLERAGTLVVTGDDSARAGSVRLRWKTKNSVLVRSPYGSGVRADGVGGGNQQFGSDFTIRRQGGVKSGRKITQTLTLTPSWQENGCAAEVHISYLQMHERIRVDTTIENQDCAASSGEYVLRVRTVDSAGEQHTREIAETWSRANDQPVETQRFYDMDGNSRLVRVQVSTSRKTNCRCATNEAP